MANSRNTNNARKVKELEDAGETLLAASRLREAIDRFDRALAVRPASLRSHLGKIDALRRQGKRNDAAAQVEAALLHHPDSPLILIHAGWLAHERGKYEVALDAFARVLESVPHDLGAIQGNAASLRQLKRFEEAGRALAAAEAQSLSSPGLLAERAWLHFDQQHDDKAAEAFAEAARVATTDDSLTLWHLFVLRRQNRYDEADTVLETAMARFPNSVRLMTEQGWLLFQRGAFQSAANQFGSVLLQAPNHAPALQGKVASLRMAGALDDADMELTTHADMVNRDGGLRAEEGWVAFARQEYGRAEASFRRVLADHGGGHLDKVSLAWALAATEEPGKLAEAARFCRESLATARTPQGLGCLGVISFRLRKLEDAERYLAASITADPMLGHQADLAALYIHLLRLDDAEKVLGDALDVKPADISLHVAQGNRALAADDAGKAVLAFRRAQRLSPSNREAATGLALALLKSGKPVDAERAVRGALAEAAGQQRATLLLLLARCLSERFDEVTEQSLLVSAQRAIHEARNLRPATAASYFEEALILAKQDRLKEAEDAFRRCTAADPTWIEADANAARIRLQLMRIKRGPRLGEAKSWVAFVLIAVHLVGLWYLRLEGKGAISDTMLMTLVPLSLALLVVALLLPSLSKFSASGIAIELTQVPATTDDKQAIGPRLGQVPPVVGPSL